MNFLVFCLYLAVVWFFCYDMNSAESLGLGRPELEIILLQSVSFLLMMCALQLPGKAARGWRPVLLTMAFVALGESSLVALLTPVV